MNFLSALYHRCLYGVAYVLLFFAIIFTLTRTLSPLLNYYKEDISALASEILGTQVSIEKVNMGWKGIEPEIWLKGVTIDQPKTTVPLFHLNGFHIGFDLIASALHRRLIPSEIMLTGGSVSIQKLPDGHLQINDMNLASSTPSSGLDFGQLDYLLTRLPHIYLNKFHIQWIAPHATPIDVDLQQLRLDGLGDHYYGVSAHFLFGNQKTSDWRVMANVRGDLSNLPTLKINVYVSAAQINFLNFLPKPPVFLGYELRGGVGDLQTWVHWNHEHITRLVATVDAYQVPLQSIATSKIFTIKSFSGNFFYRPAPGGFCLSADQVNLISDHHVWQPAKFLILYQPQKESGAYLTYANAEDVLDFLVGSNLISGKVLDTLKNISPSGDIKNLYMLGEGPQNQWASHYHVEANLQNFSTHASMQIPSIDPFDASFIVEPKQGQIHISAKNADIDARPIFRNVFQNNQLTVVTGWQQAPDGHWQIQHTHFHWDNPDIQVNADLALDALPQHPSINLLAQYQLNDPKTVPQYLPVKYLPPKTLEWLDQAFIGGDAMTGNLILKGDLSHFPFDHHEGVFSVDTNLSHFILRFSDKWPDITQMKGDVLFDGRSMMVALDHAKFVNLTVGSLTASIPNILNGKQLSLAINLHAKDSLQHMFGVIANSPLKSTVGQALSSLKFSGPAKIDLNLEIPLHAGKEVVATGRVQLLKDKLFLPMLKLTGTQLEGKVSFVNEVVTSPVITMNLLGAPTTVSVSTATKQNHAISTDVHLQATVPLTNLANLVPGSTQFTKYLSGNFNYQADITIFQNPSIQNHILIHSDLFGLACNLPRPLGKASTEVKNFTADIGFKNNEPISILASSGDKIHAGFLLKQNDTLWKLFSIRVTFGKTAPTVSEEPGLLVDGTVDYFNWKDWQPVFQSFRSAPGNSEMLGFLNKINVNFQTFIFQTFTFSPFGLNISRGLNAWVANLRADEFAGMVSFPDAISTPLEIKLQYLKLPKITAIRSQTAATLPVKLADIPRADISINSLIYQNQSLGNLDVSLVPHPDQEWIGFHALSLTSPAGQILAEGSWKQSADEAYTEFSGSMNMTDLSALVQALGIQSSLIAKTAQAQFELHWSDTPWKFSIKGLSGNLVFTLGPGWVINLGKEATEKLNLGKLLTLLSINHLFFGLGDLSKNGYAFQKMGGNLKFTNGVIQVNQLNSQGTVANIKMQGVVDAVKETLNLRMGVMVNAGSSIPVLATIVSGFNPIVGVIAWAAGKVVNSAVAAGSKYNYLITGSFSKPVVKDLAETPPQKS